MSNGIVSLATITRRRFLLAVALLSLPCIILNYIMSQDSIHESIIQNGMAELQLKLEYLQSRYISSQQEIHSLVNQLLLISSEGSNLSSDLQLMLGSNETQNISNVRFPSVYHFLPHFLNDINSLRPAFMHSKGRSGLNFILGVPHVKRDVQSYLMPTLRNLIDRMDESEIKETLIVVFIAEIDMEYVMFVTRQIEVQFPIEFDKGIIEIISPSPSFYPNFTNLRDTLGDSHQRVMWRSKQNLDFAYLMCYAQSRGTFYVQLEDDILARKNFITAMKTFALLKTNVKSNWFILDFCQLGFIGKLFKCADLPWLIQFFLMFYNDKPVDWLLDHLISTKICTLDMDAKRCKIAKAELWLHHKPSLFQHVGTHSSLKGKVQKLKDKQFGKIKLYFGHKNPEAIIESQIKPYKQYTLTKVYRGESFFWGLLPQPGDQLKFKFLRTIFIKRYLFRSGNAEHPSDKFYNTTVEVLPEAIEPILNKKYDLLDDGYVVIGKFDSLGVATGSVDRKLGKILTLRLHVHSESDNWAILSEILIDEDTSS